MLRILGCSFWLSAANSWAGAMRGFWTAELHRQQTAMANEMIRQDHRLLDQNLDGADRRPQAEAPRLRATQLSAHKLAPAVRSRVMIMHEAGVASASASTAHTRLESRAERRADAMVHVIGVTCGLAACVALAMVASPGADLAVLVSLVIYGAGLLAMLGCSALCNTARPGPLKELWRRLDHAAIFVMIAGTYTPFAAIAIGGAWGAGLLVFVWAVAAVGVVLKLLRLERLETLSIAAYAPARVDHPRRDRSPDRRGLAASLRPARCRRRPLQRRHPVLPLGSTALQPGDLARVRPHGRRMPILRHPGRGGQLRELGGETLHAASREAAISSKLRPSPSRVAAPPLNSCQRWMITSTVLRVELDQPRLAPGFSQAIKVEPEPPNGSSTMSRLLLEFRIARSTSATGFMVGCRSFLHRLVEEPTSPWSRAPHQ